MLLALSLLALFRSSPCQTVYLTPQIQHRPVFQVFAGENIELQLLIEEVPGLVASGYLLWRSPGGEFRTTDLQPVPGGLGAIIPSSEVQAPYVEYAIIVRLADGSEVTFPQNQPLVNPQRVAVLEEKEGGGQIPRFVILYPRDGDIVNESEVHIAISIFDPDSVLDLSSLQIFLDGREVKPKEVTANFISLILTKPSAGQHEIAIRSRSLSGVYNPDVSWSFRMAEMGGKRGPKSFSWSFSGEARWENFGGSEEGILRGDWRVEGVYDGWEYNARCYLTSDEAWDRQPQNRYLIGLRGQRWSFVLGDASPVFSDLVLSGLRVRGAEVDYHGGRFHLLTTFGEVNKPIAGSTYRRYLGSIRPYWTTSSGARFGLSLLKAKDDLGSVGEAPASPQDNIVLGIDAHVPLWQRRVEWTAAAAVSLTALDIRGGSLSQSELQDADIDFPFDPKPFEPLIVINESLSPPDPRGLGSLAFTTSLTLRHFGQNLSIGYRHLGPAYNSFGNPYLQSDLAGWNVSDQFSLYQNRIFFNFGLSRFWDNLKDDKITATKTLGGWVSLALYSPSPAPQVVLTANLSRAANDLATVDTLLSESNPGSDTLYSDQRREDLSAAFNVSINQAWSWLGRRHLVALVANLSSYQDLIEERLAGYPELGSDSRNYAATWRTQFSALHSASLEYSHYSSEAASADYRYNQFGAAYNGRFQSRKLGIILSAYRRIGASDLSRYQAGFSADWEFHPKHMLRLLGTHYFNDSIRDEGLYRLYYIKRF